VQSALINHCESLRYRFAILDPQDGLSIEGIQTFREPIDTKYAAIYYPWIEVRDPSVQRNVQVGPSGHMAGIYARVDVQRGVFKAPANEVIESVNKTFSIQKISTLCAFSRIAAIACGARAY
jgi:phage tail sheath protein FI